MYTFKQGINLNTVGLNPIKRNMEEGEFSLMRRLFRKTEHIKQRDNVGTTMNLTYKDNSSYIHKKKTSAVAAQEGKITSYRSYDPVYVGHVMRKLHSSGAVVGKKKIRSNNQI